MLKLSRAAEARVDGRAKVIGAARYAADLQPTGALIARFVTSPYPAARIESIDVEAARALDGVHAVLTGRDLNGVRFGRSLYDWPVLALDEVRMIGDRVVAIAAETAALADAAAALVEVTYEPLVPILTVDDALADGARPIHPNIATYRHVGGDGSARRCPNLQGEIIHEHGDVDRAFASADRVFEHQFETQRTHPGYLEPRACLARFDGDMLHVVSTNKSPFALREQLAVVMGMPEERVIVESALIGGDFGGKGLSIDEFACAFLARSTGLPVRAEMRHADDLQATTTRHAASIRLRTAVDAGGRILAHVADVTFDGGAYAAGKPLPHLLPPDGLSTLAGYCVPAARVVARTVYTNTVPGGHARAPGQVQVSFAGESHVDLIAAELGIDPVEFRLRNALRPGDLDIEGRRCDTSDIDAVLARLRDETGWERPPTPGRGRGYAMSVRHVGRGESRVWARWEPSGRVVVRTGAADQGAGVTTMIQRVVASALELPEDAVSVEQGTTADAPVDPGAGDSRLTPVTGGAAFDAATRLAKLIDTDPSRPHEVEGAAAYWGHAFGSCAYAVEVDVDRETGQIRVVNAVLVADVGTVINPRSLIGQLHGGFAFGIGQALMEELHLEDGRVTTASLAEYKIPCIGDVPPLRVVILDDTAGPGPFGAKSAGELANPAVAPAIANAVADAIGVRLTRLPLTAERLLQALARTPTP